MIPGPIYVGARIPHPVVGPSCTLQTGPFNFYDNFAGDGALASRVATPGPGTWGASATGVTSDGKLGVPGGGVFSGGAITSSASFTKSLEIGFWLSAFTTLTAGSNYMSIGGSVIQCTWKDDKFRATFPFTELAASGDVPWNNDLLNKEVVVRVINTSTIVDGDHYGRIAVCDVTEAAGGIKPGSFEVPGTGTMGNQWGGTEATITVTFSPGVVVDWLWAKWV